MMMKTKIPLIVMVVIGLVQVFCGLVWVPAQAKGCEAPMLLAMNYPHMTGEQQRVHAMVQEALKDQSSILMVLGLATLLTSVIWFQSDRDKRTTQPTAAAAANHGP
jgi:hypothetical protein